MSLEVVITNNKKVIESFNMVCLMHLSIVLKRFLFSTKWIEGAGHGRQVEQKVIIGNNKLLFHFRGHNNDLLVLKQ